MNDAAFTVRPLPINAVRWSAVLAGMAVGIAVHLALNLGGVALGLALNERGDAYAIPLAAGAWFTLSMLAGALVGGYVAARASALRRIADGMLHGTVAWGATTLVFGVIALTTAGAFAGGLFERDCGKRTAGRRRGRGGCQRHSDARACDLQQGGPRGERLARCRNHAFAPRRASGRSAGSARRTPIHPGLLRPGLTPNVTVTKEPNTTAR